MSKKMKKRFSTFILSFCILFNIPAFAQETENQSEQSDQILDFFFCTILEKNHILYLHVCRAIDVEFKLDFKQQKDQQHIRELMKNNKKFWLNLVAYAYEKNDQYYMNVDSIEAEHLNETCHLSELLDEMGNYQK